MSLLKAAILSFVVVVLPSKVVALCYCNCTTANGSTCTGSLPSSVCYGRGNSRCTGPVEACRYDCSTKLERPAVCGAMRRCSVRN